MHSFWMAALEWNGMDHITFDKNMPENVLKTTFKRELLATHAILSVYFDIA